MYLVLSYNFMLPQKYSLQGGYTWHVLPSLDSAPPFTGPRN